MPICLPFAARRGPHMRTALPEEAPLCVGGQDLGGTGIALSEETPVCVDGQGLGGTGIVLPEEAPLCVDGQGLGAFSSARRQYHASEDP